MGGPGFRDMLSIEGKYFILGGPIGGGPPNRLYEWDGASPAPKLVQELRGFNAEALFNVAGSRSIWVVSDEGGRKMGKNECKDIKDPRLKSFRSMEIPNAF